MWILRRALAIALLLSCTLPAPLGAGESDDANLEILRNTIQANKKALVAVNLGLDDAEAKAFWPVYDLYQADLTAVHTRLLETIEDYSANFTALSDEKAMALVDSYLTIEHDRVEVRRRHLKPIAAALPGKKVARFYQMENKMDAILRYELAATIPVIE